MDEWVLTNILIPRNPLLGTAVASDADDHAAAVGSVADGCFEAGDELRFFQSRVSLSFFSKKGKEGREVR
jgi:hypothetical protein